MKKLITTLIILFLTFTAQSQNVINESRRFINPIDLEEINANNSSKSIEKGSKFTIVDTEGTDKYKIYFWNWEDKEKQQRLNYDTINHTQRYFLIDKDLINIQSEKIYASFDPAYGVLTFPFKWRLDTQEVEPTFSLNLAGGVKWRPYRTNKHIISFLIGAGPSTVALNKFNSTLTEGDNNITTAAVTLSGNLLYQFDFVQFGLSLGVDKIFDNKIYNWNSQGKPWFALGIGLNVFTNKQSSEPKNKNN